MKAPRLAGNLFEARFDPESPEWMENLFGVVGARVERIVSSGQATPAGEWLSQDWTEWVALLSGAAGLRIEGDPSSHPVWRDEIAALRCTERLVRIARQTRARIHVLHISTAEEIVFLEQHKDVATCEATPHHLTLSADGTYTYEADNLAALGAAPAGLLTDSFNYTVSDGDGGVTPSTLTISVVGPNVTVGEFNAYQSLIDGDDRRLASWPWYVPGHTLRDLFGAGATVRVRNLVLSIASGSSYRVDATVAGMVARGGELLG